MFDDDVLDVVSVTVFEFIKKNADDFKDAGKYISLPESKKELLRALATDILVQIDDTSDVDFDDDDDDMEYDWD